MRPGIDSWDAGWTCRVWCSECGLSQRARMRDESVESGSGGKLAVCSILRLKCSSVTVLLVNIQGVQHLSYWIATWIRLADNNNYLITTWSGSIYSCGTCAFTFPVNREPQCNTRTRTHIILSNTAVYNDLFGPAMWLKYFNVSHDENFSLMFFPDIYISTLLTM